MHPKIITREYIQAHLTTLFIFGDNDIRKGYGGLAKECRGEPNCIGIRVKKLPSLQKEAFYTDDEYDENCRKINEDIDRILKIKDQYVDIWIPLGNGIGGGLARLPVCAPKTFKHLIKRLNELKPS